MAKDTYFFSHDYNSRQDKKIKKLIMAHGILGYGLFWAIIEDLYNNANALQTDYESIAFDLRSNSEVIKSVINDFDLFVIEGETFGSSSVERRIEIRNEKSKMATKSAIARWSKVREVANAMQTYCDSNAIKERKEHEMKSHERTGNEKIGKQILSERIEETSCNGTRTGAREGGAAESMSLGECLMKEVSEWVNTKEL